MCGGNIRLGMFGDEVLDMVRFFGLMLVLCAALSMPAAMGQAAGASGTVSGSSAAMQPVIAQVRGAVSGLQPDRWKMAGDIKQETAVDVNSIRRDLDMTLPDLLTAADGASASAVKSLAALSNVNALYDVLLRVTERARLAAPADQTACAGAGAGGVGGLCAARAGVAGALGSGVAGRPDAEAGGEREDADSGGGSSAGASAELADAIDGGAGEDGGSGEEDCGEEDGGEEARGGEASNFDNYDSEAGDDSSSS